MLAINLNQLKKGYFYLKQLELNDYIANKENKFTNILKVFQAALLQQNQLQITYALGEIKKLVQNTIITTPTNYSKLYQKLLILKGLSEPNTTVVIKVNNNTKYQTLVNNKGEFAIFDIPLTFGDNSILYQNKEFGFLDDCPQFLHLFVEQVYPFSGLHDPVTQKIFEKNEIQIILRCKTCLNFMYDFSVSENNQSCTIPNCYGKTFYNFEENEFWK